MSVLIKGMEMPKNCLTCPCSDSEYGECVIDPEKRCPEDYKQRAEWCLLVPVPPHGRCIDADALAKRIKDERRNQAEYYADRYAPVVMAYGDCYGKVQSAPTIIPACEEVYDKYTDTAGNLHWTGTQSGKHIVKAEGDE